MTSFINSLTKRKKSPTQLVQSLLKLLESLNTSIPITSSTTSLTTIDTKLCEVMYEMKIILYGELNRDVDEEKAIELSKNLQNVIFINTWFVIKPFYLYS
jgi:hypothetical protein